AEKMPEGAATEAVKQVMFPVDKQFKPLLPSGCADQGKEQFESVATMPEKAKNYFDAFKQACLEDLANERICIANAIVARKNKKPEYQKMFFEMHIKNKFPSYTKINAECNEMKAERTRKHEFDKSE
ncbi:unnamed protein product, partial [Prorocentrum cordatum]